MDWFAKGIRTHSVKDGSTECKMYQVKIENVGLGRDIWLSTDGMFDDLGSGMTTEIWKWNFFVIGITLV